MCVLQPHATLDWCWPPCSAKVLKQPELLDASAHLDDAAPVVLLGLGNVQQDLGLLFSGKDIPCSQLGLARHLRPHVCQTGRLDVLLVLCTAARKGVRCGASTAPSGLQKLPKPFCFADGSKKSCQKAEQ